MWDQVQKFVLLAVFASLCPLKIRYIKNIRFDFLIVERVLGTSELRLIFLEHYPEHLVSQINDSSTMLLSYS